MKSGDEVKKSREGVYKMVDERLGLFRLPLEARRETDHFLLESMDYLYHFLATNSPDLR